MTSAQGEGGAAMIRVAGFFDYGGDVQQEWADVQRLLYAAIAGIDGVDLDFIGEGDTMPHQCADVRPHVFVIDYGGWCFCGAPGGAVSAARQAVKWAEDNPSGLLLIVSQFSWEMAQDVAGDDMPTNAFAVLPVGKPKWHGPLAQLAESLAARTGDNP